MPREAQGESGRFGLFTFQTFRFEKSATTFCSASEFGAARLVTTV
jgi:hypothetical protein